VNTRTVDPTTAWAVLAMEAALILPIISLPTQGDRIPGPLGAVLLLLLLPFGCAAVFESSTLRDPAWRLLAGIGLALLTRAIVSEIPDAGVPGIMQWLARSIVPGAIGVALWWRGGALAVSELTPADVRNEFSLLALCLVATLAMARPFLLPDPLLLGATVGLFAVAGLMATALSRQDAAELIAPRLGRALAIGTGLTPAVIAVLLVGALRPELLASMWLLIAHAIELLLTPIGLLLAWLASLLPQGQPTAPPLPPPRPTPFPNPSAGLAEAQEKLAWIGTVIVFTLMAAAGFALLLAARFLLTNFIREPVRWVTVSPQEEVLSETTGSPGDEVGDLWSWLREWLRSRLARSRSQPGSEAAALEAWRAYQRLLAWAETHGFTRRASETPAQFAVRLHTAFPDSALVVDLVTRAFESERYGSLTASRDELQHIREALTALG
jgi:uncharacterized protein DUF4129